MKYSSKLFLSNQEIEKELDYDIYLKEAEENLKKSFEMSKKIQVSENYKLPDDLDELRWFWYPIEILEEIHNEKYVPKKLYQFNFDDQPLKEEIKIEKEIKIEEKKQIKIEEIKIEEKKQDEKKSFYLLLNDLI
jgi:hypothetical protein